MNELSPDVIVKELETPGSDLWRWSRDRHHDFTDSRVSLLVTIKDDDDDNGDIWRCIWIAR